MNEQTLLNLVSERDSDDLWSRLESILADMDDSTERESYLVKIMTAVVFAETLRHLSVLSPPNLDSQNQAVESAIRNQIRTSISQLNEKRPFDALEVQERVITALRTHRSTISAMSYDLDNAMAYIQALGDIENSRITYDSEESVNRKLGHMAHEELIAAANVPLVNEER